MKNKLILLLVLSMLVVFSGCTSNKEIEGADDNVEQAVESTEADDQQSKDDQNQQDTSSQSKDLIASLPVLPGGLVESPEKGYYVDLIKALDELYTDGNITIVVNPIARAQEILSDNQADFYFPKVMSEYTDVSKLPYKVVSKPVGLNVFVLYSHVDKKLTKEDLDKALENGGEFPYKLESSPSLKEGFRYPYTVSNNVEESVKKVDAGRIDGYIWAQEDVDSFLNNAKMKNIYRSHFYDFSDAIRLANSDKSEEIDKALTKCIEELEASGKLGEIYSKIHLPYKEWQPSEMGW